MPVVHLQLQLLSFLLLANLAFAGLFSFSIQEISVGETRGRGEDYLILAIASTTGSSTNNKTWPLTAVVQNQTIKWTNLTQEIQVLPASVSNLSVAIGIMNNPDDDAASAVETTSQFLESIAGVAGKAPGILGLAADVLGTFLGFIGDFFEELLDCAGAVVVGNAIYTPDTLNSLNQNQKICDTNDYSYSAPNVCGGGNSSYTVTYCLERLDAKSAAANLLPGLFLPLFGLAVVLICGGYGSFL
ncbi:hypothetical protein P153DRAFT_358248 [Dothidotthia symphoricarpi CBS 119687]|uniref:Uncharacterized protein n=1 Tax=Dothidotthia symphoricarpi CBS 119687 TaxID=1392245 RepID=A0A6A6AB72_9PLEO|nr:uncharacterized protein P153DRAFT_358248 [Dothidotthia symphoricarpi CBS 119687]KAF2128128.1 hypothetical protein P153DRAFT_358248 [Dothidotthia symphoricarpi CBS 119687]